MRWIVKNAKVSIKPNETIIDSNELDQTLHLTPVELKVLIEISPTEVKLVELGKLVEMYKSMYILTS